MTEFVIDVAGLRATILELGEHQGPRRVGFDFDRDADDPAFQWITEGIDGFARWHCPRWELAYRWLPDRAGTSSPPPPAAPRRALSYHAGASRKASTNRTAGRTFPPKRPRGIVAGAGPTNGAQRRSARALPEFQTVARRNRAHLVCDSARRQAGVDLRGADFGDARLEHAGWRADREQSSRVGRRAVEPVPCTPWNDEHVARSELVLRVVQLKPKLPLAHDERLLKAGMPMHARAPAGWIARLHEAVRALALPIHPLERHPEASELVALAFSRTEQLRSLRVAHGCESSGSVVVGTRAARFGDPSVSRLQGLLSTGATHRRHTRRRSASQ
jgi:hypothetical protein